VADVSDRWGRLLYFAAVPLATDTLLAKVDRSGTVPGLIQVKPDTAVPWMTAGASVAPAHLARMWHARVRPALLARILDHDHAASVSR